MQNFANYFDARCSTETYLLQTDCRVSEKTNTNDNYLISIQLRHDFCKNENGDNLLNLTIQT